MTRGDRILYIGTADGLFAARPAGNGYRTTRLELNNGGALRCPVVIDRTNPRCIYAATGKRGVLRSEDGGGTWREINDGILYKEAWCLAQHPTSGDLFVGTGPSAVFKSTDGGNTWIDCEQLRSLPETKEWTFPNPPYVSHVKDLAVSAKDPAVIFGAIEEGWLIRSLDGGETWQNLKDGTEFDSHSVVMMPDDPRVVISTSGTGIYRSSDGGDHFVDSNQGLDHRYMAQLVVHPARPQVVYTAAASGPPPAWRRRDGAVTSFYRSENQGQSWIRLTRGLPEAFHAGPRAVAGDPSDPDAILVGMSDGSVWMSGDGGDSFRRILEGLPGVTGIRVAH